jgi:hypothetical protein
MSCIMNGRMDVVKRQERGMAGTMTAEDAALSGASAEGPLAQLKTQNNTQNRKIRRKNSE